MFSSTIHVASTDNTMSSTVDNNQANQSLTGTSGSDGESTTERDHKQYAIVYTPRSELPSNNLMDGIESAGFQIFHGAMEPLRGLADVGSLKDPVPFLPFAAVNTVATHAITGVERIATAPRLITNGLFNTVLPRDDDAKRDDEIHTIAVNWLLRDEQDSSRTDDKILCIKRGAGWTEAERGRKVLLRHIEDSQEIAVHMQIHTQIEPTHIASGLAGGIKEITCSVARPFVGIKVI